MKTQTHTTQAMKEEKAREFGHCNLFANHTSEQIQKFIATIPNKRHRAEMLMLYGLTVNMMANYCAEQVVEDQLR